MDITALLRRAGPHQAQLRLPRLQLRSGDSFPTAAQSATTVHISNAARSMANKAAIHLKAASAEAAELREFLRAFDFSSITPNQMAQVGGRLFEKMAISESAASAFIGVEKNLVDEMDPDKAIDMYAHFQRMLDVATSASAAEPGYFDFAVKFRREASKALDDVTSFVSGDRDLVQSDGQI